MKQIISFILTVLILSTMFTVPAFASEDITIISPGASCTTDISEIVVECSDAQKIIFELDGVKIGETNGETKLALSDGTISVGNHTLKVSAIFPDKTAAQHEISFNAYHTIVSKSYSQNFNSFTGSNLKDLGMNFVSANMSKISADNGASGALNDKSLKFEYNDITHVSSTKAKLEFPNFANFNNGGILDLKFDIKTIDPKIWMELYNISLAGNNLRLLYDGKFHGLNNVALNIGGWNSIEIHSDETRKNIIYKLNDSEIYNGKANTVGSSELIQFMLKQINSSDNDRTSPTEIWFDNIDFSESFKFALDSLTYSNGSDWTSCDSAAVPVDAFAIKLNVSQKLDPSTITAANVALYENGKKVEIENIAYSDGEKSVTIVPKNDFSPDSDIMAELSENVKLASGSAIGALSQARFRTEKVGLAPLSVNFKKGGSPLVSTAQLSTGDVVKVNVQLNNTLAEEKPMTVIVCVRQNKKLRAIGAKSVMVGAGETPNVEVVLPALAELDLEGDISVKLSICDTYENGLPYVTYTELK